MKKVMICILFVMALQVANAQIKIGGQTIDLSSLLNGKLLEVKKGFAPKFNLGDLKIGKLSVLNKVLSSKNSADINKLFKTFRTGKTVWHIGQSLTGVASIYSAIKSIEANAKEETNQILIDQKANLKKQVTTGIIAAAGSAVVGLVIKLITKKASYKAVDMFNGVVKKKITDIFSVEPYSPKNISNYNGVGLAIRLK